MLVLQPSQGTALFILTFVFELILVLTEHEKLSSIQRYLLEVHSTGRDTLLASVEVWVLEAVLEAARQASSRALSMCDAVLINGSSNEPMSSAPTDIESCPTDVCD